MIKDEKDLHWQLVELIAYWQGTVNATHLIKHFHISRKHAGDYLRAYREHYPLNLVYCTANKGFTPTNCFQAQHINGDVAQYLDWLSTSASTLSTSPPNQQHSLTYTSLNLPSRQVSPQVMRGLVSAIKQQRRIDVEYVSLTNPNAEGRIIQPHVFVKTGLRWHLRAYDEKHKEFRDFVLSRFFGTPDLLDKATHHGQQDQAWNTLINIVLAPDPRLNPAQQAVLIQDYQMQHGQLVIPTRAALAQYLLQEMLVNFKFHDKSPEAQQLVLVNEKEISPWLFNA